MRNANLLFEKIFKKNIAEGNHSGLLTDVCEKYPYFSPAHFFLLKQADKNTPGYAKIAAKTSVFFNNPYWLNFQVNCTQKENETSVIADNPEEETTTDEALIPLTPLIGTDLKLSDTTEDTITFEPLHTSDYFASQGIKLSEQVQPEDKLGQQLKSFTQWLKTMKKIHYEQVPVDAQTDTTIQKLAEKSNTEDETITEAMAEVLVQQGKINKALELYQKLSLQNPSKSAYFAAKIEQLNK